MNLGRCPRRAVDAAPLALNTAPKAVTSGRGRIQVWILSLDNIQTGSLETMSCMREL
jgi:hypothetical protein